MTERTLDVNGAELCAQTFGDRGDPAVLLIGGAASSMDWWDADLCRRIAAAGRYVIRYDHRDTGRSTSSEPGKPSYTGADLTADVTGVLDALGLERAHLVGLSMGGGIAQEVVLTKPDRVATLTLMCTSPLTPTGRALPPPAAHISAKFAQPAPEPDWSDRAAVIDWMIGELRAFAGSLPFDEAYQRDLVGRGFDRTTDYGASQNHWILGGDDPVQGDLADVTTPTLVMHGADDPLFPLPHGEALAATIPGAKLVVLPGVGHEFPPPPVWDLVAPAIVEHTAG
jgi:pimeloyl-ACP methyl ester carboxylesterase